MKTSTKTWLLAVAAAAMLAFPPRALATGESGFRASSPPDAQWITHSSTSVYNTDWNSGHWATGDLGVITLPASAQFTVTVYGSGNGGGLFCYVGSSSSQGEWLQEFTSQALSGAFSFTLSFTTPVQGSTHVLLNCDIPPVSQSGQFYIFGAYATAAPS